ncbi:sodium-dependent transporter [Thermococcus sp.]|uniref:sodium-dependent transporter n=1 Tax=Thermococcus sp. TaxID=35749 RepID=UPI00260AD830|nr:sodium-dependent transporter [Thermococcus sp.]
MRRVSVLMALLITGYILGIWNFLILPKYFMVFGLKGLLVSLVPILVAMFLIYSEAESTKRTRYLIYELFFKVARTPAFIFTLLMFLLIMLGLTAYLSSWSLIYIFGWDVSYIPLLAILTLLLTVLLLLLAKGRVLEFISGVSVLMIVFTLASAYLVREQALNTVTSEQAKFYMHQAVSAITSFGGGFTVQGLTMLTASVIIAFGLGAGVYYVIGSFSPEDLDFKRVLVGVFFLQLILSFAAAYTMAYSLGPAFQAFEKSVHSTNISPEESIKLYTQFHALQSYATNSTTPIQDSIKVFYTIPRILKGVPEATRIIYLLALSLYFAGLTTLIVLMEMGSQMLSEMMQLGRKSSLSVVTLIAIIIAGVMALHSVRVMFLFVPFGVAALVSALEAYPLFSSELTANKGLVGASIGFLVLVGIGTLYYAFINSSIAAKLGAVIGLVLFVPAFMNSVLLKSRR